jgi:hypothetical protein
MAKLLEISDPAEDAALIAARAYNTSETFGGYGSIVENGLLEAGLDNLRRNPTITVTLDAEQLSAVLAEAVAAVPGEVHIPYEQARNGSAYSYVADAVYEAMSRMRSHSLRDIIYSAVRAQKIGFTVPDSDSAGPSWTPETLLRKYGRTGAMPTPAGERAEEITAQRLKITRAFCVAADKGSLCSEFDRALATVGLRDYAPARELTVTAEVAGLGTVTAEVHAMRAGTVTEREVRHAIAEAARQMISGSLNMADLVGLPEGALV